MEGATFANSKLLFDRSLGFFKKEGKLIWVSVPFFLPGILFFAVAIAVGYFLNLPSVLVFFNVFNEQEVLPYMNLTEYIFWFVVYTCLGFINFLVQGIITAVAYQWTQGSAISVSESKRRTYPLWQKLLAWSAAASAVGSVLTLISEQLPWGGEGVSAVVGIVWGFVTFYVLPLLVLENHSLVETIKKSGHLFKGHWGTSLVTNIYLGLFFFLLYIVVIAASGVLAAALLPLQILPLTILFITAGVIAFLLVSLASYVISTIAMTALYVYVTTGIIPNAVPEKGVADSVQPA